MKKISWSDEYKCGYDIVDKAHRAILEQSELLHQKLAEEKKDEEAIAKLSASIVDEVLGHMDYEIELLKQYSLPFENHAKSHDFYREKFDLKQRHSLSSVMRGLMVNEMVHDYMAHHFVEFDISDLKKINKARKEARKEQENP